MSERWQPAPSGMPTPLSRAWRTTTTGGLEKRRGSARLALLHRGKAPCTNVAQFVVVSRNGVRQGAEIVKITTCCWDRPLVYILHVGNMHLRHAFSNSPQQPDCTRPCLDAWECNHAMRQLPLSLYAWFPQPYAGRFRAYPTNCRVQVVDLPSPPGRRAVVWSVGCPASKILTMAARLVLSLLQIGQRMMMCECGFMWLFAAIPYIHRSRYFKTRTSISRNSCCVRA